MEVLQPILQNVLYSATSSAALTAPTNTAAPAITSADTKVGTPATVTPGTYTGTAPITKTYQWTRNNINISGATTTTYVYTVADLGTSVRCKERASNAAGNVLTNSNAIVATSAAPFLFDANTYWYDTRNTGGRVVNTAGASTVALIPDLIGNKVNFQQITKDYQPLSISNGVTFNRATKRALIMSNTAGIANGKYGWFFCANLKMTTATGNLFNISRASSASSLSRCQIDIPNTRTVRLRAIQNDGTTPITIGISAGTLTLNTTYTVSVLFDVTAGGGVGSLKIWIDNTLQTLTSESAATFAVFPSTNPFQVTLGNLGNAVDTADGSLDGSLSEFVFYNSVPTSTIYNSIRTEMIARKFA